MVEMSSVVPIDPVNEPRHYRIQYQLTELPDAASVNRALREQYHALRDDPDLERTHYFEGRYENVYVPRERMPALEPVLNAAVEGAAAFLQRPAAGLSVGFWMNDMAPGHVTLPHTHDDDDELLSAVYYISIPENSGELILRQGDTRTTVSPREGVFVFFPPDVIHEVTENKSRATRLSIGMNFGVR